MHSGRFDAEAREEGSSTWIGAGKCFSNFSSSVSPPAQYLPCLPPTTVSLLLLCSAMKPEGFSYTGSFAILACN